MANFVKMSLFLFLIPIVMAEMHTVSRFITLKDKRGPKGIFLNKSTTCEDFGKNASFNPHSVVNVEWFVFYYWTSPRPSKSFKFRLIKDRDLPYLHYWLDTHVANTFNWTAVMLLMEDQSSLHANLLIEDHGVYWIYLLSPNLPLGELTPKFELRVKQIVDNKYLAIMDCEHQSAFLMARIKEVPSKEKIEDEAAKLGYRGNLGRSYLVNSLANAEDYIDDGGFQQIKFQHIKDHKKSKRYRPTFD